MKLLINVNFFQFIAPPQPVLMQFLSPEGTPKQTAVQYIQLLRPIMMVPGSSSQYLNAKTNPTLDSEFKSNPSLHSEFKPNPNFNSEFHSNPSFEPQFKSTLPITSSPKPSPQPSPSPFVPYSRQQLLDSYSSPQSSYFQTNPLLYEEPLKTSSEDLGLNTNEYIPSASSQHASVVLAPRSSMIGSQNLMAAHSMISPYVYQNSYTPNKYKHLAQRA